MTRVWSTIKHEYNETVVALREIVTFVRQRNWRVSARWFFQRRFWKWHAMVYFIIIASAILSSYHEQISHAIGPYKHAITRSPWAWIIPVVVLFIISFPPLVGHEIVLLVCGMLYGTWIGFAIACAGTFLGELGCYVAFKYYFRPYAIKLEDSKPIYACCAKLMREGGLWMLVLVRFSAMPGHIVTAIQSCIGIGVWKYALACFITLPKQFALCYIGKVLGDSAPPPLLPGEVRTPQQTQLMNEGKAEQKRISLICLGVTILVTAVAAYIVYMRARALRPAVLAEMEARRLAREEEAAEMSEMEAAGTSTALRKPDMRLELDKPPAFADFERWNSSKGSLRTPLAEREGLLGMALNSPSLPHLPRYSSKVIDGDEILLAGRSRSGTTSSRVSVGLMTRQPSEQAPSYFDGSHTPSQAALAEGEEEEGPSGERARRRSEPNWQKRDWE